MFHALIQKYQGKGVGWLKGSEEENLFSCKGEGVGPILSNFTK